MSFPDLVLEPRAYLHSKNQGVPVNGANEFAHGIDPKYISGQEDRLRFKVTAVGPSVAGVSPVVVLSADKRRATLNIFQLADDEALIEAELIHSTDW